MAIRRGNARGIVGGDACLVNRFNLLFTAVPS